MQFGLIELTWTKVGTQKKEKKLGVINEYNEKEKGRNKS